MNYRIEKDTLGQVKVPADKYWGAQTQRSIENFKIGEEKMPQEVIKSYALLKKASAIANHKLGVLPGEKAGLISGVCDEITRGELKEHFPLLVWQTGSGTQTNMNVNEVIANRGQVKNGKKIGEGEKILHPNDDVNKSQSSNDTFPTVMHISAVELLEKVTIPGINKLITSLEKKSKDFNEIVKTGRTHCMDAIPLTLGQEFSGYVSQLKKGLSDLIYAEEGLMELVIGGTAVGTGLNAPSGFSVEVIKELSKLTGYEFVEAENKYEGIAAHDALVSVSSSLKRLAVSLMKIANDIRLLASGPRCGLGELILPSNEPGSSIMPGKVNPTQVEALTMVCAQVIGNDVTIVTSGMNGHLELNVFKPVILYNLLQSARLIGDACYSFSKKCIDGIEADEDKINYYLERTLMLATSLNNYIGYEKASDIAKKAFKENISLKEAALSLSYLSEEEFKKWVNPKKMTGI